MNFQVTVLKILVSYPDGFAVMADLKRDMAILATSGRDWAKRTKRLAARVPDLDIFSQALVERLNGGWRITEKGRSVLDFVEARPSRVASETEAASRRASRGRGARAETSRLHESRPKPAPAAPAGGARAGTGEGVLIRPSSRIGKNRKLSHTRRVGIDWDAAAGARRWSTTSC